MNRIFRSVRNACTGSVVAVSELASCTGAGRTSRNALTATGAPVGTVGMVRSVASIGSVEAGEAPEMRFARRLSCIAGWLLLIPMAHALPGDGVVNAGSATITGSPGNLIINQASQNASLNWSSFNIGAGESVRFIQPNAMAVALNRVLGPDPSIVLGSLSANGKVFLVNPNGILFGAGAQVNVGGLIASTLPIGDRDFMAGNYRFAQAGPGKIVNQGTINANGGYVALLGARVSNDGVIQARMGSVALAAGNAVTLDVAGDGLLHVAVPQGAVDALVTNGGLIRADGGSVLMTAQAAGNLMAGVVNNTGIIEARTLENRQGAIRLLGDMRTGAVQVGGVLDASAPAGGDGGFVETSAAAVKVVDAARVTTAAIKGKTGTWLIDPHDYTVAASGGDITGAVLSGNLQNTGVTILSSSGANGTGAGNININDAVTWNANTQLTLTASNHVNVNASITANGANAGIVINPNTANGAEAASGSGAFNLRTGVAINLPNVSPSSTTALVIGGNAYTVINSLGAEGSTTGTDLQGINGNLSGRYALGSNIDASPSISWESGAGFKPLGDTVNRFTGTLDGLGHAIRNLTIYRPFLDCVGLVGYSTDAILQNVGIVGGSITGASSVGSLAGQMVNGAILNSYASANVSNAGGGANAGGLLGHANHNASGTVLIRNSYATGAVSSNGVQTGGLVGRVEANNRIEQSYATGNVTSSNGAVGGLVGFAGGIIVDSYATGNVTGAGSVGGLAGRVRSQGGTSTVTRSYASGNVTASGTSAGGLAGTTELAPTTITDSYATGNVTSTSSAVGGLVGSAGGTITNVYSTGAVSGTTSVGGLIGTGGAGTRGYWNTTTSGRLTSAGGSGAVGVTTAQMQQQATFSGWDFTSTWTNYQGFTNPLLRTLLTPLTVTAIDATRTYDRTGFSGGNGVSYSIASPSNLFGTVVYGGTAQGAINAGSYAITPSGLYSNQQGYLISYASGTLTVNPKSLTVSGLSAVNKTYDGTTAATTSGGTLVGVIAGDTVTLTTAGAFASKNVGVGIGVIASVTGASAGNYTVTAPSTLASITAKPLTVTGSVAGSKVYDGTTAATLSGGIVSGVIGGDEVLLAQAGNFSSKNVGTARAITANDSLGGTDAGNYALIQPTGLTANITAKPLTVTAAGMNKVYDGTVAGSVAFYDDRVANDILAITSGSVRFADKNAATGKTVNVTGINVTGADAGNYTYNTSTATTANITARALNITATGIDKPYDGTLAAGVRLSDDRVNGDLLNAHYASAQFADKSAGNAKPILVDGLSISGLDAANYTIRPQINATADITPRTLIVTAEDAARRQGEVSPVFGAHYAGFVVGEDPSVLSGVLKFSTPAGAGSVPGAYPLRPAGQTASNYAIGYVDGTLRILPFPALDNAVASTRMPAVGVQSGTTGGNAIVALPGSMESGQMPSQSPRSVVNLTIVEPGARLHAESLPGNLPTKSTGNSRDGLHGD